MKRLLLTIFSLLIVMCSDAATVTKERALEAAEVFFAAASPQTKSRPSGLSIVWDGESYGGIRTMSSANPDFYVITRDGGGFVIIAGDDRVRPVLGFSFDSPFSPEGMPDNVRWWMEGLKLYCRSAETGADDVRAQWAGLTATKSNGISQVTGIYDDVRTPEWAQSEPFNIKTPVANEEDRTHALVGCLPVAMGEILTWFGYPEKGTGKVGGYSVGEGKVAPEEYSLGTTYNWDWIRSIKDSKTAEQMYKFPDMDDNGRKIENLAELLFDCGAMLKASFGEGSTGAYSNRVARAFGEHMGFNKSARIEYAANHTRSEWISMVKSELDKWPILYCGTSPGSDGKDATHAFVLDGYAFNGGEYVFHVNFGWGGYYNGYYFCTNPNPGDYDFKREQSALFDFHPSSSGTYQDRLYFSSKSDLSKSGLETDISRPLKRWDEVTVSFSSLSAASESYSGCLQLRLEDKYGNLKQIVKTGSYKDYSCTSYYSESLSGLIFTDVEFGDKLVVYQSTDLLCLYYEKIPFPLNGSFVGEYPAIPAAFIFKEGSYSRLDMFQLRLTNNDYAYEGCDYTTSWTFVKPSGQTFSTGTQQREICLDEAGQWTVTANVTSISDGSVKDCITATINVN